MWILSTRKQDIWFSGEWRKLWYSITFLPQCSEDQVRGHLRNLKGQKFTGPGEKHPEVLRELSEEVAKLWSIMFEKLWQSSKVPADWNRAKIALIFKKGNKDDPGNYGWVSLTSARSKTMEQILLETLLRHVENDEEIGDRQQGFTKGKSKAAWPAGQRWWFPFSDPLSLSTVLSPGPQHRKNMEWLEQVQGEHSPVAREGLQENWKGTFYDGMDKE